MGRSFGIRHDHLLNFMDYAEIMNVSPLEMFAMHLVNCQQDAYKAGCGVSWTEYDFQVPNRPTRMSLAQKLYDAEMMIGNYLKTPVGPTYIKGEMHTLTWTHRQRRSAWNGYNYIHGPSMGPRLKLQTRYRNVIKTGTQVLTRIGPDLPQTRTFIDRRGWGFTDDIVYCIGDSEHPLSCTTCNVDNLCNLRLFQPGFGPIDNSIPIVCSDQSPCTLTIHGTEVTVDGDNVVIYKDNPVGEQSDFYNGHRIRPFHASYDGTTLCLQVNKTHNAKLELYSGVIRTGKRYLDDLDFCDDDTYPEYMEVYNVSYERPDGIVYLRRRPCGCTTGCDACDMREVPICLVPIDPIAGEFYIVPIKNTSEDDCEPCWEQADWDECCFDLYGDANACGCDTPIIACINYVASACGNWDDCCIPDDVCPELKSAVAYLATGMFGTICDCGCLDDLFGKYSMDMMLALAERRSGSSIYAEEVGFRIFGQTRGAYEAYNVIRYRQRVHPMGDYMIG